MTISTVLLSIVFVVALPPAFYPIVKGWIKVVRGKKMIKAAKAAGPHLVMNTEKGVTAVCSYKLYTQAERLWIERPIREADEKKRAEFLTQRMELLIQPTFTFYMDDSCRILAHTSHYRHLELLRSRLVARVTGYRRDMVDQRSFDIAVSCLMVRRRELLIPFMRPVVGGLDPVEQVRAFKYGSAQDAFYALLP